MVYVQCYHEEMALMTSDLRRACMDWRLEQLHSLLSGAGCKNGVLSFFKRMLGTGCSVVVLYNSGWDWVERIDEDCVCKYCVVSYERFSISPNNCLFNDALEDSFTS